MSCSLQPIGSVAMLSVLWFGVGCSDDPLSGAPGDAQVGTSTDASRGADLADGGRQLDQTPSIDATGTMDGSVVDFAPAVEDMKPAPDLSPADASPKTPDLTVHDVTLTSERLMAGSGPNAIATADFNGDGIADIATANSFDNSATVFLGKGDGTFLPARASKLQGTPSFLAAGDFNGDHLADLAVLMVLPMMPGPMPDPDAIGIYLSQGNGALAQAPGCFLSQGSHGKGSGLVVADLNGDGFLDTAAGDGNLDAIQTCFGNGTALSQLTVASMVLATPYTLAPADFDGDGVADLAVGLASTDATTVVDLFHGRGDGSFIRSWAAAGAAGQHVVVVGDLDGDGKSDVADVTFRGGLALLDGNGDGTFGASLGGCCTGLVASARGDFNGDGIADLALLDQGNSTVLIDLGIGKGAFSFTPVATPKVGALPIGLVVADFDRNGTSDVAVADNGSNDVYVLLNGR